MTTTTFRLDRGAAMLASGVGVLVAAALALVTLWWRSPLLFGLVAVVVVAASWLALRPPVVVRLDERGYASRVRFSSGRFEGKWADVAEAELVDGLLVLTTNDGPKGFPLSLVGHRRVRFLHAVSARLDAANGYQRWLG